jgi:hypothetical protein
MLGCYPALPHGIEIGSQHPVAPSIKTPTPAGQSRAYNRVSHILEGHTELFVSGIILPVMRLYDTLSLPAPTTRFLRRRTHSERKTMDPTSRTLPYTHHFPATLRKSAMNVAQRIGISSPASDEVCRLYSGACPRE